MRIHNELELLAALIKQRNEIDKDISETIGRPAERGHIGEFVAAEIFDIELHGSANYRGSDGIFRRGKLAVRTVNIKCYGKNSGILAMKEKYPPDFYLVLTGPKTSADSSRNTTRPWSISSVFLFDHHELVSQITSGDIGHASVKRHLWDKAEIYPNPSNGMLLLTPHQRSMIELFGN